MDVYNMLTDFENHCLLISTNSGNSTDQFVTSASSQLSSRFLHLFKSSKRLSKTTLSPSPKPSSKENQNKTLENLYSPAASSFLNVQQSDRCGTCITMNLAVSVQEQVSIHVYKNFLFI